MSPKYDMKIHISASSGQLRWGMYCTCNLLANRWQVVEYDTQQQSMQLNCLAKYTEKVNTATVVATHPTQPAPQGPCAGCGVMMTKSSLTECLRHLAGMNATASHFLRSSVPEYPTLWPLQALTRLKRLDVDEVDDDALKLLASLASDQLAVCLSATDMMRDEPISDLAALHLTALRQLTRLELWGWAGLEDMQPMDLSNPDELVAPCLCDPYLLENKEPEGSPPDVWLQHTVWCCSLDWCWEAIRCDVSRADISTVAGGLLQQTQQLRE